MTQLEDFRSDLDESDPMALERARARLHAAQSAAGPARSAAPRRRVGLAAAAGSAASPSWQRSMIGIGQAASTAACEPAPADAHAVLVDAADSAADAATAGCTRLPEPDEFYYLEIRGTYRDGIADANTTKTELNTRTYRRWESLTRPGLIETGSRQTPSET